MRLRGQTPDFATTRDRAIEVAKKLEGRVTSRTMKANGFAYGTFERLVREGVFEKTGGAPEKIGADVCWVYVLARRLR